MYDIRLGGVADADAAMALVTRLQPDPTHHIGYLGATTPRIADDLAELAPDWPEGAVLATDSSGRVRGMLFADVSPRPARLYGPFVDVPSNHPAAAKAWNRTADALYVDTLRLPRVRAAACLELSGDLRHRLLAGFAERHGFTAGHPVRTAVLRGPDLRALLAGDTEAVVPLSRVDHLAEKVGVLHERCFPDRTVSARELLSRTAYVVVVLPRGEGRLAGFAAGRVSRHEYRVDYVAVQPDLRGVGVGRLLVGGLLRELDDRHGARTEAVAVLSGDGAAMFDRLGFVADRELVRYRRGRQPS